LWLVTLQVFQCPSIGFLSVDFQSFQSKKLLQSLKTIFDFDIKIDLTQSYEGFKTKHFKRQFKKLKHHNDSKPLLINSIQFQCLLKLFYPKSKFNCCSQIDL